MTKLIEGNNEVPLNQQRRRAPRLAVQDKPRNAEVLLKDIIRECDRQFRHLQRMSIDRIMSDLDIEKMERIARIVMSYQRSVDPLDQRPDETADEHRERLERMRGAAR